MADVSSVFYWLPLSHTFIFHITLIQKTKYNGLIYWLAISNIIIKVIYKVVLLILNDEFFY